MHLHVSLACDTCALLPDGSNVVPLADPLSAAPGAPVGLAGPATQTLTKAERGTAARQNLKDLKQQFMQKAKPTAAIETSSGGVDDAPAGAKPFVDRARARRARNALEPAPIPVRRNAPPAAVSSPFFAVPGATAAAAAAAHDPFDASSRGALLLGKLTKQPPPSSSSAARAVTGSGAELVHDSHDSPSKGTGLGKLIDVRGFAGGAKAGLGSRPLEVVGQARAPMGGSPEIAAAGGWRENVKEMNRRRFKQLEAS